MVVLIVCYREADDDLVEERRVVGKFCVRKIRADRKFELVAPRPIRIAVEKGPFGTPVIVGDRRGNQVSAILKREKLDRYAGPGFPLGRIQNVCC